MWRIPVNVADFRIPNLTIVAAIIGCLTSLIGCGPNASENKTPSIRSPQSEARTVQPASAENEFWYADFIGDAQVGWTHITITPLDKGQVPALRIQTESEMSVKRFGTTVTQNLNTIGIETTGGRLVSFESKTSSGADLEITTGNVQDSTLMLEISARGTTQKTTLDWKPDWGGTYAVEQSLRRQPLKPGELRKVTALVPVLNQVGTQTMRAVDYEKTDLLGEIKELLRVAVTLELGQHRIESIIWTDPAGAILKSKVPAIGQISYRTTAERARAGSGKSKFDLGDATLVKVHNPPRDLAVKHHVVYKVSLVAEDDEGDIATLFPSDQSQQVTVVDQRNAEVDVRSVRPDTRLLVDSPKPIAPSDADRSPNARIQSNHPAVVKLASKVPNEPDPWKLACALEQLVRQNVRSQQFAPALASAATVAETLEGDCTEHAVLLAAICRYRQIPARIVVGLVYSAADSAFAFHMWNEVWIEDNWIPLDGTRGRGGTTAAYLKLATSNLQVGDDANVFLPVFQVLGRLEVTVVSAE